VALVSTESRAHADDPLRWPDPIAIAKLGVGLPGAPGVALEVFAARHWTVQGEGGDGLIGPFIAASGRWRPRECGAGGSFGLALGPEVTVLLDGGNGRRGVVVAGLIEPSYVHRFRPRFGLTAGVRFALGYEWDFEDGDQVAASLANTFAVFAGVVF
jgi:hypothetical protein